MESATGFVLQVGSNKKGDVLMKDGRFIIASLKEMNAQKISVHSEKYSILPWVSAVWRFNGKCKIDTEILHFIESLEINFPSRHSIIVELCNGNGESYVQHIEIRLAIFDVENVSAGKVV